MADPPTAALSAEAFLAGLQAQATDEQRVKYQRYFPGDGSFIGVPMGTVFAMAKAAIAMPLPEIERLLESPIHEARAGACSIMGKAATHPKATVDRHGDLYELYLRRHDRIDDWDLVDLAAHQVVGTWLLERPRQPLYQLAESSFWPERRSAIVATAAFLKRGDVADTFAISRQLMADQHDLVHKGAGWMLRYAGEVDRPALRTFLDELAPSMPRTMLRYAIEKLDPETRRSYLRAATRPTDARIPAEPVGFGPRRS
jgi:3-methyladenine DNA glycosylase AlkD